MTQDQAFKILLSGENVFLTGSAGSGKTFLLSRFINALTKRKISVGITASTGIAATHLGGRTIHSWSGMGIEQKMSDHKIKFILRQRKDVIKRIRKSDVLIIDEISMLDADRLDLVNQICKAAKDPFLPFGGMQLVMCGDFFQLPPIGRDARAILAYDSFSWHEANVKICYLTEQHRHSDLAFAELLNKIRDNNVGETEHALLRQRINQKVDSICRPTKLFTHNYDADIVNDRHLNGLSGKEKSYKMSFYGPDQLAKTLKSGCLAPQMLKLKKGAVVMFIKNNFEKGYVNGTLGRVVGFSEGKPLVETSRGYSILAERESWCVEEDGCAIAGVKQIPLRLAWGITVHKSQGMSLDAAEIDLSKSFERGMGYVALSRVRTLSGINLLGINDMALLVSEEVALKDKEFKNISNKLIS